MGQWVEVFQHASRTISVANRAAASNASGIITCFPQLAFAVALLAKLRGYRGPIVAYHFNVGHLPDGLRLRAIRWGLNRVDRFVVHSTAEISAYARWLNLPPDRFRFIRLQRAEMAAEYEEEIADPFILAMGSAGRDYRLLFAVMEGLPHKCIVVAGEHAIRGLPLPRNVEVRSGLSIVDCHKLLQRCRLSVTPLESRKTAAGQVTFLDAMMFGRPQIVTRCVGSSDYLEDGVTALMVAPGDEAAFRTAINKLWHDARLRAELGEAGRMRILSHHSDHVIAKELSHILDEWS